MLRALCLVLAAALVAGETAWPWSMWRPDAPARKPVQHQKVQGKTIKHDGLVGHEEKTQFHEDGDTDFAVASEKKNKEGKNPYAQPWNLKTTGMPAFYHTSDEIVNKLTTLKDTCPGMELMTHTDTEADNAPTIHYVLYKSPEIKMATNRVMVVAGEHARELIGPETALQFLHELCNGDREEIQNARTDSAFMVVVNANPVSRKLVENGEYCLRANPAGTDINRNWDVNWGTVKDDNPDTRPGSHAFSEAETRTLRDLMESFVPHIFLNLHSGNLGMYLPNKYIDMKDKMSPVTKNLVELDEEVCKCPLGIANELVGYRTCGSSLDYSFEKVGTKFSMAVEIFVDKDMLPELRKTWGKQKKQFNNFSPVNFLEGGESFPFQDAPKFMTSQVEEKARREHLDENVKANGVDWCIKYFNPTTQTQYQKTTTMWSHALFKLVSKAKDLPEKPMQLTKRSLLVVKRGASNQVSKALNLHRLDAEIHRGVGDLVETGTANNKTLKLIMWVTFAVALVFIGQKMGLSRLWLNRKGAGEARPLVADQPMGSIQVSD